MHVATPDGKIRVFEGLQPGPAASLELRDWNVIPNLLARGDTGFASDYRDELWDTQNLTDLITVALQNENVVEKYLFGNRFFQLVSNLSYSLRSNTKKGSRRNIHQHYDLGNDFYSLWLDSSMTYSSAIYGKANTLEDAQANKYDRIIDRFEGTQGRTLEIGCGWGGYAERASARGHEDIKCLTISKAQHDYAAKRLDKKAEVALEDYRDVTGRFDKIASIEMFEAVGERYWPVYFSKLASLLTEKGAAVIQTITIEDARFEKYRSSGDAIRSFIFPGGMLPCPSRFKKEAEAAGLKVTDQFAFGQDYARTLEEWLKTFDARTADIKALGFDTPFIKLWRFYLASCIAGFRTGRTDVMQYEIRHA